jgi:hypothetical protein
MPIFQLTPLAPHLDSPQWKGSLHQAPALVQARNERVARMEMRNVFRDHRPGVLPQEDPWVCPALTTCEPVLDSGYLDEGWTEILEPEGYGQWPQIG